ncbi:MAG: Pyrroline-5-carboxylate reductase [Stenotrophomonas maltophilia]|uniref:Pyrroline-5-carboxylate reductase n=1 Tax=Stenotrophomonas maltophilia TaxID=40324 RepID=A0A7V8JLP2_STEMA|nr:MAG: Pyrroline-5-carboxylate reductase [Stenotrophomonas maltophilia]
MIAAAYIAFIDGGNMARCLLQGLLWQGQDPTQVVVADPLPGIREDLAAELGVQVVEQATQAAQRAPLWVLAVKPQAAEAVCRALATTAAVVQPQVVSIMAGVTHARLQQWLGIDRSVRSMPNQPAAIGAGITALHADGALPAAARAQVEALFRGCGSTLWLGDEAQMDTATAVSSSGPAYLYLLAETLQHAAEARGLPADSSRQLAQQTLLGAARMLKASPATPAQLRAQVTSPGGTTQAALAVLAEGGWPALLDAAVGAAQARAQALAAPLE